MRAAVLRPNRQETAFFRRWAAAVRDEWTEPEIRQNPPGMLGKTNALLALVWTTGYDEYFLNVPQC